MIYSLFYAQTAEKDLARLPKAVASRIAGKLGEYTKGKNPLLFAKKLKGIATPTYRFRIGSYRAIFRLDPKSKKLVILVVLKIAHRREVYEK